MESGTEDSVVESDDQSLPSRRAQSLNSRRSASARRSNTTPRTRLRRSTPNTSSAPSIAPSLSGDDQSLTSFPSLSPSLENSPVQNGNAQHSDPLTQDREGAPLGVTPPAFQDLFTPAPDADKRSTLFFDGPHDLRDVPGTLHLQSDEQIKRLISRRGAAKLVKQLSSDLAQRDSHITMVQRKAEERENLLKKMLRECEVSNLDIENRLKDLERTRLLDSRSGMQTSGGQAKPGEELGIRSDATVGERMSEALSDNLDPGSRLDLHSKPVQKTDSDTVRAAARQISGQSQGPTSGTSRGWKGLFGGGTDTVKRSSGPSSIMSETNVSVSSKRARDVSSDGRELDSSQNGSVTGRNRNVSSTSTESGASASSNSVASWALRMVAGDPQSARLKAGVSTAKVGSEESVAFSKTVRPPRLSTAVRPRSETLRGRPTDTRSPRTSTSYGAPLRKVTSDHSRFSGIVSTHSPHPSIDESNTNLGPVEMDTILPEDTRPPTLVQGSNLAATDFLTDNFGFIYDNRRRRKMREAAAAMPRNKRGSQIESLKHHRVSGNFADIEEDALSIRSDRPDTPMSSEEPSTAIESGKPWQDFLNLSNMKTDLLSLTPSPATITDVTTGEPDKVTPPLLVVLPKPPQIPIRMSDKGTMPAPGQTAEPSTSRVVSENAEMSRASASYPTSPHESPETEIDPVKALVEHLSEVHETVQKGKTVKWNDFLRKVRADRRRDAVAKAEGDARSRGSDMPETHLADGEMIGVAGLGVRGKVGRAKGNEFRSLVLAGIPTALRSKIWAECSGALNLRVPGYYEDLTNSAFSDETIVQQIQMDITRTLTDNIYFRVGAGVEKLKEVLLAYARRNPDIGYCQGMNLITANLLLIMPTAEDAFWVLTSMVENILPEGYYSPSLITSRADQVVLRQYVKEVLPQLSQHLDDLGIELEALTFQWFLSVFTDCLSAEALFRVWDVVLCLSDAAPSPPPKLSKPLSQQKTQGPAGGSATFLFQVALALLKLNEHSLIVCESPAEVYRYINRGMTDHAISIDNLIRASEALRKEVLSEDVVARRTQAVEEEMEMMKRREAIRKGKGKASDRWEIDDFDAATIAETNGLEMNGARDDATPRAAARRGRLSRKTSRRDLEEEEEEAQRYGPLEIRTPMPVDEEIFWRT